LNPASARAGSGRLSRIDSGFVNVPKTIPVDYPDIGRVDAATSHCKIVFVAGKKNSCMIICQQLRDHGCETAFRKTYDSLTLYPSSVPLGVKDVFVSLTETPAASDFCF